MKKIIGILLFCLLAAAPAHADSYTKPTWPNLVRTLVRFNALNLGDDRLLDEYAIITECDLYKNFYRDDFKWNEVRQAIRQSVKMNIATFPTDYGYVTQLQLGRYDFHENLYRFTDKTTIKNVNSVLIYKVEGSPCDGVEIKLIPVVFRGILDTPFYFEGLPLASKDAEALLKQMKDDNNTDHIVYTSFNLRVVYIEPLRKGKVNGEDQEYTQAGGDRRTARLDMQLDSIDFYEDPAMTKLIYHYQP